MSSMMADLEIGCASSAGVVDTNVRDDIAVLKNSPYVRKDVSVLGYVLDVGTSQLREVK
jgi:carbonic anhydrase